LLNINGMLFVVILNVIEFSNGEFELGWKVGGKEWNGYKC